MSVERNDDHPIDKDIPVQAGDLSAGVLQENGVESNTLVGLSKNAQKRILKAKRMEELKKVKRQREKERKKEKKQEARAKGIYLPNKRSKLPPQDAEPVEAKVVIDLGFDELMTEKEISSICSQLNLTYSSNRLALKPFESLLFCGQGSIDPKRLLETQDSGSQEEEEQIQNQEVTLFDSKVGERMQTKLLGAWQRWQGVGLRNQGGLEGLYNEEQGKICSKDQIVYLTADTETILDTIKEGEVYVIGGLVDRNRYKNICAEKAKRLGIRTAKLPINAERLKSSMVMTVNQVMNILLEFNKTQDWEQAFDQHLPQRKMKKEDEKQKKSETETETTLNSFR